MAPSFEIGKPQRSLVRIPGSGWDQNFQPICLEVAQIKAIGRPLSTIVDFNFEYPPDEVRRKILRITPLLPPHSNFGNSTASSLNQNSIAADYRNRRRASSSSNIEGPPSKRSFAIGEKSRSTYIWRNVRLSIAERKTKIQKLMASKKAIEEENAILEAKVAKFKEIIASKSKLKRFLKFLKEMEDKKIDPMVC